MLRTDGKENLITSIEIAAAKHPNGTAIVPEVCIFFENHLLRGNRTTKINAENFNAFRSYNFPSLATAGIHIKYEYDRIHKADPNLPLKPHYLYDTNVIILTLFPGIQENMISNILIHRDVTRSGIKDLRFGQRSAKAVVHRTSKGCHLTGNHHCQHLPMLYRNSGNGRYETGLHLLDAGVISGYDSTVESVLTKLMFLLGHGKSEREIRYQMSIPVAGEFTKS